MKNTISIKLNREFLRVYKRGNYKAGKYIVIYTLRNRLSYNRLGISTGKKVGNAVQRNRMKRLVKEIYTNFEDKLSTGFDIVVSVKSTVRAAKTPNNRLKAISLPTFHEVDKEFKKLSVKLGILDNKKKESDQTEEGFNLDYRNL